jgi:hypothetical protein
MPGAFMGPASSHGWYVRRRGFALAWYASRAEAERVALQLRRRGIPAETDAAEPRRIMERRSPS